MIRPEVKVQGPGKSKDEDEGEGEGDSEGLVEGKAEVKGELKGEVDGLSIGAAYCLTTGLEQATTVIFTPNTLISRFYISTDSLQHQRYDERG